MFVFFYFITLFMLKFSILLDLFCYCCKLSGKQWKFNHSVYTVEGEV